MKPTRKHKRKANIPIRVRLWRRVCLELVTAAIHIVARSGQYVDIVNGEVHNWGLVDKRYISSSVTHHDILLVELETPRHL
jgi:hypothetical protein